MYHEEDEDMLQILDQKYQSIEIENEIKESALEENTSETQEIPAGTKEVMYDEDGDEDVLQIWDQKHQSIEIADEIKESALETISEGEETNLETQGNQEDKDILQIWDLKHQNIEVAEEIKEHAMEETTSETQEIPAGTQEVMCHEEDNDMLQILVQKHQNIEVADEFKEPALETISEGEENNLETQDIPAGNQEDQDMLQIWDQKRHNVEVEDEIKEPALEETTSETQEIPAGNQEVMYHEEDEDMLQILDQKHQNIEIEDENEEPVSEMPSEGGETNLETQGNQEDKDILQIWDQKCQSIEVEDDEIMETAMETPFQGEETNSETQEIPAGNQEVLCHEEDKDMLQMLDQKHQNIEFKDKNKYPAMEETTSETQELENLMLVSFHNNIESFDQEHVEEVFADSFERSQLLFFKEPACESINIQPYGELPSAEQNQTEDQPQEKMINIKDEAGSHLNEQPRFQTSVLIETKVHELDPGPNEEREVAQEVAQEVHAHSASTAPHMEVTNPSVHRGHRVTAALTNDGNSLFLLASRLEESLINYTTSSSERCMITDVLFNTLYSSHLHVFIHEQLDISICWGCFDFDFDFDKWLNEKLIVKSFISTALYTIQIVSKQLYINKQEDIINNEAKSFQLTIELFRSVLVVFRFDSVSADKLILIVF